MPLRERREKAGWGPWSLKEGVIHAHAPARALNQVLDITGLRAGMLERLFARAIAVPAGRFLRMKRSVNLRIRESNGKGVVADGRYQSPILVQWDRAAQRVRSLDVTLTRFE